MLSATEYNRSDIRKEWNLSAQTDTSVMYAGLFFETTVPAKQVICTEQEL
jgi:hypothetical protein